MSAVFKKLRLKGCCWSLVTLALSTGTPQIGRMVDAPMYNCPNCNGLYHVVKVEVPPIMNEAQLTCLSCGGPLNAREGRFALKYFFIDRRSGKAKALSARKLSKG